MLNAGPPFSEMPIRPSPIGGKNKTKERFYIILVRFCKNKIAWRKNQELASIAWVPRYISKNPKLRPFVRPVEEAAAMRLAGGTWKVLGTTGDRSTTKRKSIFAWLKTYGRAEHGRYQPIRSCSLPSNENVSLIPIGNTMKGVSFDIIEV